MKKLVASPNQRLLTVLPSNAPLLSPSQVSRIAVATEVPGSSSTVMATMKAIHRFSRVTMCPINLVFRGWLMRRCNTRNVRTRLRPCGSMADGVSLSVPAKMMPA